MGWACNVLRNIDPNFIVHYFVHGSKSCGLVLVNASSNRSGEFSDCTGFSVVAFFYKFGGSPLFFQYRGNAFDYCGSYTLQAYSRQERTRVI